MSGLSIGGAITIGILLVIGVVWECNRLECWKDDEEDTDPETGRPSTRTPAVGISANFALLALNPK
jgi:hypothetical protein